MKFRNQIIRYYMDKTDDIPSGGGGGGQDEPTTYTAEEYKALQSEKSELLKESMKRKDKIQGLEATVTELNEKFKGIDLDLYSTMLQERKDAEQAKKEADEKLLLEQGKFDELLASKASEHEGIIEQMRTKHKDELGQAGEQYKQLESNNQKLMAQVENLTVGAAFGNSQLIREDMISAMTPARVRALYGDHFEPNEKGEVIGYDKPKGVEGRAPIVDSDGKAVSFDAALKTILEKQGDFDSMLKNKVKGAGSGTEQGGDKVPGSQEIGSGIDRINHALNKKQG